MKEKKILQWFHSHVPGNGTRTKEVTRYCYFHSWRDVFSSWKVDIHIWLENLYAIHSYDIWTLFLFLSKYWNQNIDIEYIIAVITFFFSFFPFQRGRNAGAQQKNRQQNVLVEFAFTLHLLISSWVATMALEVLLWEKETHLKFWDVFFFHPYVLL